MTLKEVAEIIIDQFDSIKKLDGGVKNGKLYFHTNAPKWNYDITNTKPEDAILNKDYFMLSKADIIEVFDLLSEHQDINEAKKIVSDFIEKENVNEAKPMFLVPFFH